MVGGTVTPADVLDARLVDADVRKHSPDVVINCAGVSYPGPLTLRKYEYEITVNLIGAFKVADSCIRNGVGTQIHIGSVAGMYGKPNHASYSASKAGVISLVRSLGMEGHNAYCISPGRVDTKMREKDYPGEDKRTRLDPLDVGAIVVDIIAGKYEPGDNIIIRKIGFDTHLRVDKGEPWREWLRVGQPPLA